MSRPKVYLLSPRLQQVRESIIDCELCPRLRDYCRGIGETRGVVTLDGREIRVPLGETIDIPQGAAHRIANPGDLKLIFIEIQRGDYLGEDDIVRLQDDFGRVGG